MPTATAIKRARRDAQQGRKPTTQAGEFVRDEMRQLKRGSSSVRSRRQAVAIGLSQARRAGVPLGLPAKDRAAPATRRKAGRDAAVGAGRARVSPTRSRGAKKAARTRERHAHPGV